MEKRVSTPLSFKSALSHLIDIFLYVSAYGFNWFSTLWKIFLVTYCTSFFHVYLIHLLHFDLVLLWVSSSNFYPPLNPHLRRVRWHNLGSSRLRCYPRHWMILFMYMFYGSVSLSPLVFLDPITTLGYTWGQKGRLKDLAHLNIRSLLQYQKLCAADFASLEVPAGGKIVPETVTIQSDYLFFG